MTMSMYQASAPRFVNMLNNLSAILDKAQAHADARKIDPTVFTTDRLFPHMLRHDGVELAKRDYIGNR